MANGIQEPLLQHSQFDADGFIIDPGLGNEDMSQLIARTDDIGKLTANHWRVIDYLREHFLKNYTIPVIRHICRITRQDPHCVTNLFGEDVKEAWRVAGLPNPGEEAKAYM
ncbi:MAG: sulfite reductase [Halobacteria archaeon]|nr:sulfite reductase [Halobacteria archaeon]